MVVGGTLGWPMMGRYVGTHGMRSLANNMVLLIGTLVA
jgi:hypothetical protein